MQYQKNVNILFTIKTLNVNVKIGENIKIVLKLKTKAIIKKEIITTKFPFNLGKRNNELQVRMHQMKLTGAERILGRHKDIAF